MEQHLTQRELEDLFWRVTLLCLGITPPNEDAQADDGDHDPAHQRVRVNWPTGADDHSAPDWQRDEDVCFLQIAPGSDPFTALLNQTYKTDADTGELSEIVTYTRVHTVNWIFYGPNAGSDADRVRVALLRGFIRDELRVRHVYPVSGASDPVRLPELERGEWWERYDLTADFYEGARREYGAERIEHPPDIIIKEERTV